MWASARWAGGSCARSTPSASGSRASTASMSRSLVSRMRETDSIYAGNGLDLPSALGLASEGRSIAGQPGVRCWPSAIDGLRATEADLLVEVTASPSADGEPGVAHIREALRRGIPVVTSNKWPVALHGVELAELARSRGVAFRAESTVMSGTPVLSALVDGLAGAVPVGLRGLLNATANFILSRMAEGTTYEDALAEAQTAGLAERDPAADVEGHDAVAKVMILSALVFGRQLRREQVACRGITDIARSEIDAGRLRRGATQARRNARVLRAGRSGERHRARGARARSRHGSAGEHRGHQQRGRLPSKSDRRGDDHRTRRRPAARRARRVQRPHRSRTVERKRLTVA